MKIERSEYIEKLENRLHNGMIKVVTGIRRSGKSYLIFELFREYLLQNKTDENHIISIELERLENRKFRQPEQALDYIKSFIKDDKMHYIFLDEIQMMEDFVEVLNSFNSKFDYFVKVRMRKKGCSLKEHPFCLSV